MCQTTSKSKKPKPKGTIIEKVCAGTQKPCKTPNDCRLRHCNKQKCQRPKMELKCFSHEDCKLAPKCKVNPTGKQLPNKPKPKVCEGNKSKDCTNDIDCKVEGCKGKVCSNVESKMNQFNSLLLCLLLVFCDIKFMAI